MLVPAVQDLMDASRLGHVWVLRCAGRLTSLLAAHSPLLDYAFLGHKRSMPGPVWNLCCTCCRRLRLLGLCGGAQMLAVLELSTLLAGAGQLPKQGSRSLTKAGLVELMQAAVTKPSDPGQVCSQSHRHARCPVGDPEFMDSGPLVWHQALGACLLSHACLGAARSLDSCSSALSADARHCVLGRGCRQLSCS